MYLFKGALVHQPLCSQEDPVVPEAQLAHMAAAQLREICPYFVIHPERGSEGVTVVPGGCPLFFPLCWWQQHVQLPQLSVFGEPGVASMGKLTLWQHHRSLLSAQGCHA